ncbi:MAG: helix-turn-helix domain-containing protein [Bacillota bacterium]
MAKLSREVLEALSPPAGSLKGGQKKIFRNILGVLEKELYKGYAEGIEIQKQFEQNRKVYQEYGGIRSPREMQKRFPITPEKERHFCNLIRQKVEEWAQANPGKEVLKHKVFVLLTVRFCRRYGVERVNQLPVEKAPEAEEWLKAQCPFKVLEDLGPLPAHLMEKRAELQKTQREAAEECGIGEPTFKDWETGRRTPCLRNIPAIAAFLGKSESEAENLIAMQRSFQNKSIQGSSPLREMRRRAGYTVREAAKTIGISRDKVQRLEIGNKVKNAELLKQVLEHFYTSGQKRKVNHIELPGPDSGKVPIWERDCT